MYGNENVLFPKESKSKKTTKKRVNSVSRLMRDLKEWEKCKGECPCIDACPLEDNIYEWHCNIAPNSGSFRDVIFHVILYFSKKYPSEAPEVKLCTTIPHPNVFGDWICLDMIKRYEQGRYKGWTSAYCVSSILMQLQSFLFEEGNVDQMEGYTVSRRFDKNNFERNYLPRIKKFECETCNHTFDKPYPIPLSVASRLEDGTFGKSSKQLRQQKYNKHQKRVQQQNVVAKNNNNRNNRVNNRGNKRFAFWDGIYADLEQCIFSFFNVADLMKLQRVAKRFATLVKNTKMIQKDSIRCWFHRVSALPSKDMYAANADKYKDGDLTMLLLGYGVTPQYFSDLQWTSELSGQLFASRKLQSRIDIVKKIGGLKLMQSVNTTFDLLSSDAFENFQIRKSVFKDAEFTHFLPLYINKKHGKLAMKQMKNYIMRIWTPKCGSGTYHPWLAMLTIANTMKSLIVSVMQVSEGSETISLHYSINILEAFFRLHHTLLGIYIHNKSVIEPLLQHEINLFFKDKSYRNKQCVPDYGIFLVYLTVWTNPHKLNWNDIATQLLDETFTRQVKWVIEKHSFIMNSECSGQERMAATWDTSEVSRRLFMFNYFFFKQCCGLGDPNVTLDKKFEEYNDNFGFPKDDSLPVRLQSFVKTIQTEVTSFTKFFQIVEVKYPGFTGFADWLRRCMLVSEYRGYHKPWKYDATKSSGVLKANFGDVEEAAIGLKSAGLSGSKAFKWGQQKVSALASNNKNNGNNINTNNGNNGTTNGMRPVAQSQRQGQNLRPATRAGPRPVQPQMAGQQQRRLTRPGPTQQQPQPQPQRQPQRQTGAIQRPPQSQPRPQPRAQPTGLSGPTQQPQGQPQQQLRATQPPQMRGPPQTTQSLQTQSQTNVRVPTMVNGASNDTHKQVPTQPRQPSQQLPSERARPVQTQNQTQAQTRATPQPNIPVPARITPIPTQTQTQSQSQTQTTQPYRERQFESPTRTEAVPQSQPQLVNLTQLQTQTQTRTQIYSQTQAPSQLSYETTPVRQTQAQLQIQTPIQQPIQAVQPIHYQNGSTQVFPQFNVPQVFVNGQNFQVQAMQTPMNMPVSMQSYQQSPLVSHVQVPMPVQLPVSVPIQITTPIHSQPQAQIVNSQMYNNVYNSPIQTNMTSNQARYGNIPVYNSNNNSYNNNNNNNMNNNLNNDYSNGSQMDGRKMNGLINNTINGMIKNGMVNSGTNTPFRSQTPARGPPIATSNLTSMMNKGFAMVKSGSINKLVKSAPHNLHGGAKPRRPPIARCFISSKELEKRENNVNNNKNDNKSNNSNNNNSNDNTSTNNIKNKKKNHRNHRHRSGINKKNNNNNNNIDHTQKSQKNEINNNVANEEDAGKRKRRHRARRKK